MFVGAKFMNVCGSRKAERTSCREVPDHAVWIPAKSTGHILKQGTEAATAAVPSRAEAKKASRLAFIQG
jgi:hypothetical protein